MNPKRLSTGSALDGRNGEVKVNMWSSMLDNVASGKKLPEKNILVLGGSADSQREFLETLSKRDRNTTFSPNGETPPVANTLALGYTYYDVIDSEQEDTLARVSLYFLSNPSSTFASLITPLLTPQTIPNTLITILLDWTQPHQWLRQIQKWILMLRVIMRSVDRECTATLEGVMEDWRDRGRTGGSLNLDGTTSAHGSDGGSLPLGPGEWDDALGLPLCVVCQNAEKIEALETNHGWKEADFDQILQYLRTILLRHGASLVYTTPNSPSPLPRLIHTTLGISTGSDPLASTSLTSPQPPAATSSTQPPSSQSLLAQQSLKPNSIDRDRILIPPNWDSWSKIRILRDGFDVELISNGWKADISQPWPSSGSTLQKSRRIGEEVNGEDGYATGHDVNADDKEPSAISLYEESVPDVHASSLQVLRLQEEGSSATLDVLSADPQAFLEEQAKVLESVRKSSAAASDGHRAENGPGRHHRHASQAHSQNGRGQAGGSAYEDYLLEEERVHAHIGPVQFNMGGIQVDADDMLRRLKDRRTYLDEISGEQSPTSPTEASSFDISSSHASPPPGGLPVRARNGTGGISEADVTSPESTGSNGVPDPNNSTQVMDFFKDLMQRKGSATTPSPFTSHS